MNFDREKLDAYRVSLKFTAWSYAFCRALSGKRLLHRLVSMLTKMAGICLSEAEAEHGLTGVSV